MRKELVGAGAAFGLVMVGTHLGLTGLLGAHPFWAVKVGYVGAVVGLVLAVGFWWMRVGFGLKLALAAGLLILTAGSLRWARRALQPRTPRMRWPGRCGSLAGSALLWRFF